MRSHLLTRVVGPAATPEVPSLRPRALARLVLQSTSLMLATLALGALPACDKAKESSPSDSAAARPIPVLTAAVERRELPLYLDGLGTVAAFQTVTVRTQVDGRLQRVLFREGQKVTRGELLAEVDPRPFLSQLHQAEGALARDTALLANTRKNLQRYAELRGQSFVSQQQVDDQQALVGQYEGSVAVDKAQAETAKLNLEYSRITAPIDGVTGVRLVDQGNLVHPGDPSGLVVITQIDPIAVLFTLPQDDLPKVIARMEQGKLPVEAWSRDGSTRLALGELTVLDNQINVGTATLRLKAVFDNPQRQLWPNQFVKARLLLSTQKDALVVPAAAVQRGPKGTFIYVVAGDGTASPRPVEVEITTGDQAVLAKGLTVGEQIVVEGQNQLRPGAKVAARSATGGPPKGSGTKP